MKAKEYLRKIQIVDSIISAKMKEVDKLSTKVESLLTIAAGVQAIRYDKDKVQSSTSNKIEDNMIRVSEATEELNRSIRELENSINQYKRIRRRITTQIELMGAGEGNILYSEVLYRRYVLYMSFEQIAVDMGYSYQHILRIHGLALKKFQEMYLEK